MQSSARGSRNIVGLALVVLGIVFLLDTLEVFGDDTSIAGDFWPLLIVAIGFIGLAQRGFQFALVPVVAITVGTLLLIGNLTDVDVWQFWPVLLIIIGLWLVWRRGIPGKPRQPASSGEGTINASAILGGNEQRVTGEFKGGRVTAMMGGGSVNLADATLPAGGAVLDVNAILGSYEIRVPTTWRVTLNVDAFLGSAEDKRSGTPMALAESSGLEITGSAILGSVEVK